MMTLSSETPIILVSQQAYLNEDCACASQGLQVFFESQPPTVRNDCACADTPLDMHFVKVDSELPYSCISDPFIEPLRDGFYVALSPLAPDGPTILNHAAYARWQAFEKPIRLSNRFVDRTLAEQRLIVPHGQTARRLQEKSTTLTAWLHITNACNLDCPYCYVRKSSACMSKKTASTSIQNLFRSAQQNGFERIKLKYAGGESTLHFALIRAMHEQAMKLSSITGIELDEVILSNGVYLSHKNALWIKEKGIKLAISLDGIGADHDRQRPRRSGSGSFEAIERTIDTILLPLLIKPDITVTITRLNARNIDRVVRWALMRDLPISLNFYRTNPAALSRSELELEEQTIITGMTAAYAEFEKTLPARPFLNGLLDRVQTQAHTHTCGAGISYAVIDHEGRLAQCQMRLDAPIGEVTEENWLNLMTTGPIHNLPVDDKEGCQSCVFRYRCTGGCSLETFRATGRWDISSPHCRIYKTLYPKALRLEGLRLLKVNGY